MNWKKIKICLQYVNMSKEKDIELQIIGIRI